MELVIQILAMAVLGGLFAAMVQTIYEAATHKWSEREDTWFVNHWSMGSIEVDREQRPIPGTLKVLKEGWDISEPGRKKEIRGEITLEVKQDDRT